MNPFTKKETMEKFPCGKCGNCLDRKASAWSFRLMQESKVAQSALFVTLTYSNDNIKLSANRFATLSKRDVQLFFKRLRKHGDLPIRYYLAGEYGSQTFRPHYHIILFNASEASVLKAWDLGDIHFGTVEGASIGYTLKYISKPSRIPLHRNDDRTPEFALMSKGIGKNYLTPQMVRYHKNDLENHMFCTTEQGIKLSMPRYYKTKIYNDDEYTKIKNATALRAAEKDSPDFDPHTTRKKRMAAINHDIQKRNKNQSSKI